MSEPYVCTLPSGIIKVIVNTESRWLPYSAYTSMDIKGRVNLTVDIFERSRLLERYVCEVYSKSVVMYSYFHQQEKDQITVLFVPFSMLLERG